MHHTLKHRVLPVVAGAAIVVGGLNVASYAANGQGLLLGHANSESKTATVTNSGKGPALSLKSGKKSASLAVSSSAIVKHLNADAVDGFQGKSLQTNVQVFVVPANATLPLAVALNTVSPGHYLASFDVAMHGAATTRCFLGTTTTSIQVIAYGASVGTFSIASASGLLTVKAGETPTLTCNNGTTVVDASDAVSRVLLTRVDHLSKGTTGAPPGPHGALHLDGSLTHESGRSAPCSGAGPIGDTPFEQVFDSGAAAAVRCGP